MIKKDIIIIGGGASGIICAIKAKENNPDKTVAILEKQNRIGRKLLSTGNGRCNLLNIDANDVEKYNGSFNNNLRTVFKKCSAVRLGEEFSKLGLVTYCDSENRVYPYSNHAGTVLDILRFRLIELGIDVICDTKVTSIEKKDVFIVKTEEKKFSCDKLVISTGSPASPKLGSDNSGINLLEMLGHKIEPLSPALCPLEVKDNTIMPPIKGVRQKGSVALFDGDKFIKSETGEIQFTENSLSGICIFNLSVKIKSLKNPIISLNISPYNENYGQLLHVLKINAQRFKNREILRFLDGMFINKLGIAILKCSGIKKLNDPISTLKKEDIENICDTIYDWKFKVEKPTSFDKAQVCSGGVNGSEIEPKTMESKKIKGLYICGEAVDIVGDCGGFNLNFAFSSGIIAGESL